MGDQKVQPNAPRPNVQQQAFVILYAREKKNRFGDLTIQEYINFLSSEFNALAQKEGK